MELTEKQKEYWREYRIKNKEKRRLYMREYYKKHSEKQKQKWKEWRENNRERYNANRRATNKKRTARRWASQNREMILSVKGEKCDICDAIKDLQLHHREYVNKIEAIQVLCKKCHNDHHFYSNLHREPNRKARAITKRGR